MNTKTVAGVIIVLFVLGGLIWGMNQTRMPAQDSVNPAGGIELAIEGEEAEYFEGAQGYFVRPQGEAVPEGGYPGIVLIHENRGLRPEIKTAAEKLAREGYLVLAADLFNGKVVESQDEARVLTSAFDQKKGIANMQAAVQYLKERGATKVASWGWCFGGKQSVELAISGTPLDATVVYYGGGLATTTQKLAPIKWPVLGIFGDKDQVISTTTVDAFKRSLDTLGIENEVYMYPGVGHAFANPSNPNHAPAETADAWIKTVVFLNKYLK